MGDEEPVLVRRRVDTVEVLTLNRPEARNALDPALTSALSAALREALGDDGVRVVVLTGAGEKAFCAGMDLRAFSSAADRSDGDFAALTWFQRGEFAKPAIAAVNGAAVAGGFELMLACDLVVAAEHARFGIAEVKRGLLAAGGGTLLSTRVPLAWALELGLTGDFVDAARAREMGLVNRIVPAERVLDEALALAQTIAANGPLAVRETKRLLREAVAVGPERGWPDSDVLERVFRSEDAMEGARAFVEKRPPQWTGR